MSIKNIVYVKKTIFGILLHVVVKMENILKGCDKCKCCQFSHYAWIKLLKKKQLQQILMKKMESVN